MAGSTGTDPWDALRVLPMGRRVELTDPRGATWTGTVVPRHELSGDRILPIKLESGYNVGIRVEPDFRFRLLDPVRRTTAAGPAPPRSARADRVVAPGVALLTTGGTIASRVDYETGGVRPVKEERELLAFYPELDAGGPIRIVPVLDRLSEDVTPTDWTVLAERVVEAFRDRARGVVITHGTDTLGLTASALSFLLVDLPGPVVLVGAQRSPDRPSSDGPSNIAAAVRLAREGTFGEVVVLMHAGLSDGTFAVHRGTGVRKMHSSRRDAFESRNASPLATVDSVGVRWHRTPRPPVEGLPRFDGPLDPRGGLLTFYPGLDPARAAAFVDGLRGVVLAGTGLGHVASAHLDWIRAAVERGVVVAMTTQSLGGAVDPFVYATGRELERAGVVYLGDLLPETAYTKLLWALGHGATRPEVEALLRADVAGEFEWRHLLEEGA